MAGPPYQVNRAAPVSGARSFMPSFAVSRRPLKVPRRRGSRVVAARAVPAASWTVPHTPYSASTVRISQSRPGAAVAARSRRSAAAARSVATRGGRRRKRSARAPSHGAAGTAAHRAAVARAARLSEAVSSFTQTPATRAVAEEPKPETRTAPRIRDASRSRRRWRAVRGVVVMGAGSRRRGRPDIGQMPRWWGSDRTVAA